MFLLKNVQYLDILAIDNLEIGAKQVCCIVGKSGSGKSTLLKILNRMLNYDVGEVYYKQQLLTNLDVINHRRSVVMLGQTPIIFNGNIKDNLLIGLRFSKQADVLDSRLYEILKIVMLDKQLTDSCDNLSGGEKQRLALGRVLLLNPEVLLLDEPSSALDDDTALDVIANVVAYVRAQQNTLILVTHSKLIANKFANQKVELAAGKVINVVEGLNGTSN